jgi:ribosomal protein S18 acetylase RimI-like enzyme
MVSLDVLPATADRWADVVTVFGTRGDPASCWCQYFHLRGRAWSEAAPPSLRDRLHAEVTAGDVPPGVLAYSGGEPLGWCQVGPKAGFARLAASKVSVAPDGEPDPDGLWAVTCFVVPVRVRRRGVARGLLDGAVAHAAAHGARVVEAYPVDPAAKASVSSAELYHGSLSMFEQAGFVEVRRPLPARAVVRRELRRLAG